MEIQLNQLYQAVIPAASAVPEAPKKGRIVPRDGPNPPLNQPVRSVHWATGKFRASDTTRRYNH
jgi:hypothetical protein